MINLWISGYPMTFLGQHEQTFGFCYAFGRARGQAYHVLVAVLEQCVSHHLGVWKRWVLHNFYGENEGNTGMNNMNIIMMMMMMLMLMLMNWWIWGLPRPPPTFWTNPSVWFWEVNRQRIAIHLCWGCRWHCRALQVWTSAVFFNEWMVTWMWVKMEDLGDHRCECLV